LLGIKVIKLNKIKGTPTVGVQICSLLETGASFLFKAGNFRLPAQTKICQTEISPLRRQLPNRQNLGSNPSPKNRRRLDA
jgi:hypothetical protein